MTKALTLREDYKVIRYNHNLDYVMSHTSTFWLANFFNQLKNTTRAQKINKPSHRLNMKDCIQLYKKVHFLTASLMIRVKKGFSLLTMTEL